MRGEETDAAPGSALDSSAAGASRLTVPLRAAVFPAAVFCPHGPRVPFEPPKPDELEDPLEVTMCRGGIAGGCWRPSRGSTLLPATARACDS